MREFTYISRKALRIGSVLSLLLVLTVIAAASALELDLRSYKVVLVKDATGKEVERLVPAKEVKPGDILEWVLKAKNNSDSPLKEVSLTIPIPPYTVYLAGTARPLRLDNGVTIAPLFSYDGTHFARPPLTKVIKVEKDGRIITKVVIVPPEQYTHVRWVVPSLAPSQMVKVGLRTKVR